MLTEAPLTSMGPCAMCIAQPAQSIATPLVRKYVAYICSLHFYRRSYEHLRICRYTLLGLHICDY